MSSYQWSRPEIWKAIILGGVRRGNLTPFCPLSQPTYGATRIQLSIKLNIGEPSPSPSQSLTSSQTVDLGCKEYATVRDTLVHKAIRRLYGGDDKVMVIAILQFRPHENQHTRLWSRSVRQAVALTFRLIAGSAIHGGQHSSWTNSESFLVRELSLNLPMTRVIIWVIYAVIDQCFPNLDNGLPSVIGQSSSLLPA